MQSAMEVKNPSLAISGLDGDLTEEEVEIQTRLRNFAVATMRPVAASLDEMSAQEVIQPCSPLWKYLNDFDKLGIGPAELAEFGPERLKRLLPIVFEELAYGDSGLAVAAFISKTPASVARASGDPKLVDRFGGLRGCWVATQADRGSDCVDYEGFEVAAGSKQSEGSLRALVGSSEIVLTGHSSDWIACGPIAECGLVHCPADYGEGVIRPDGGVFGVGLLVPFDLPGVSVGSPNEKIGQRSLPTGSIRFDDVRVPNSCLVHGRDSYNASIDRFLLSGAMNIAAISTGIARAAFEAAVKYAQDRRQGGVPLTHHQLVRWRLYEMWRKVEISRAIVRRAAAYNFSPQGPHVLSAIAAKTTASQSAFDVVSSAMQIFGANGVSRRHPMEKLLRDVQEPLVEAGENHFLALQGANWLLRANQVVGFS